MMDDLSDLSTPFSNRRLEGPWVARAADADDRFFADPDLDDSAWHPISVPGHWAEVPELGPGCGPVRYRHRFRAAAPSDDQRWWLVLDGACYSGEVFIDGYALGLTEGYFVPHAFDVTEHLEARDEHLVGIELDCPDPGEGPTRILTGSLQRGEMMPPGNDPGGLWRPVRLESTGPVRIDRCRVVCREADEDRAIVGVRLHLDAAEPTSVVVRTLVDPAADRLGTGAVLAASEQHQLAAGANTVDWRFAIESPTLWWPRQLGEQFLYDVRIEVLVDGVLSHVRKRRLGLRQVEMSGMVMRINGRRLFVKGAVMAPPPQPGSVSAEDLVADLQRAADAGLNLVRLHTHIAAPELYRAADRMGMLIWQDLPLHRRVATGARRQALRQARIAVDLLGHHPSVALWCARHQPSTPDLDAAALADRRQRRRWLRRELVAQQVPSWNRFRLDRSVARSLSHADPGRPVLAHSGVLPHLPLVEGTDSHLWLGWYRGKLGDLAHLARRLPRLFRFVGELGAQAVPNSAEWMEPERWPELDWDRLSRHHLLQKGVLDRHVPPGEHEDFAAWRQATQRYQASLVRHHIETLRRLKYRPTGGWCVMALADQVPSVGFGLLDHQRRPKMAWDALVEACRPVLAVADPLPAQLRPRDRLRLQVHLVNDLPTAVEDLTIRASLSTPDGVLERRWSGAAAADSVSRVGRIAHRLGSDQGPVRLVIELEHQGRTQRSVARSWVGEDADRL